MFRVVVFAADVISIHALREEGDDEHAHGMTTGKDFYPRPPRGGRRARRVLVATARCISIHALREEGDIITSGYRTPEWNKFLSTPSARRATSIPGLIDHH